MEDESKGGGGESCSVDGCRGSLGGLVGGGGGADGVSNITAEYFEDLKRVRSLVICFKFIMATLKCLTDFYCVHNKNKSEICQKYRAAGKLSCFCQCDCGSDVCVCVFSFMFVLLQ